MVIKLNTEKLKRARLPVAFLFLAVFAVSAFVLSYGGKFIPANATNGGQPVIILDAGHGGADSGCIGINGELEKDINLAIVKDTAALLRAAGFTVIQTRDSDVSIYTKGTEGLRAQKVSDMENRKAIIDKYPDSIFISVHQNKFVEPQYYGGQMFYTENNADNVRLARVMQGYFKEYLDSTNERDVKLIDNGLYLFKSTEQPALMIECGFLSNPKDAANLSDTEYQKKTAFVIFKGIISYLGGEQGDEAYAENDGTLQMR
ncbi:MAG: N-acetylmuramoyl-L-alanine amidase [Oscillospiraceae bacterium]|jgi:N-acetylmuramoyl-L-alanine amidase|nr:N-acetylmuramoyl-L-alanine amidase [Oscillospiraceae bacterium]